MEIRLSEEEYLDHVDNDDGVCTACGQWTEGGVEPDAENYECDNCEARAVMGAEQAFLMSEITLTEDA